jgi:L-asparaginase
MKRVLLVSTGDTIAQRRESSTVASASELLTTVDTQGIRVVTEDLLAEPSWDTSTSTMLGLARRVRTALRDEDFDGVVVVHGIDTLAETAFLTDLVAGPAAARGGIVFTGATRFLDDPDSDGPRNLGSSLVAAADGALREAGAVLCFDGEIHAARWAKLTDVTRVDAFSSAPHQILGRIVDTSVELTAAPPRRLPCPADDPETDVALIKTYPGIPPGLVNAAVDAGARGVVLEGTGQGNVPVELFATISELTGWDIPVVIASSAYTGNATLDDLPLAAGLAGKVGAIGARGLAAAHARVALMVTLGGGGVAYTREWFGSL